MTTPGAATCAILGGGVAGLLAAHRLRQRGCRVVLLEASSRPGGMIRTVRRDGWVIDTGALTLAEPEGAVAELLGVAGAAELLQAPAPEATRRYLVHQGRPVAVPTSTAEMVATPLLSVGGRLRMLREPFVARGGNGDETVAAFARRRFGEETAARFIDPLVSGTSGGDPEELLAAFAFPRLVEFEQRAGSILKGRLRASREARRLGRKVASGGWSARGGLGSLTAALGEALGGALRADAPVAGVQCRGDAVRVELASGETLACDGAVVALPASAFGAMRWDVPGPDLGPVAGMPHTSLATVSLGYPRASVRHPLDGHGVLAPSGEQRRVLSIVFASTVFPDRAPGGHVLLTGLIGGAHHEGDVKLDDAALTQVVQGEIAALLGATGDPVVVEVARWPRAMPLAIAGHRERLATASAVEEVSGRLAFCGAWHDGLAVGDAMRGGVAAADRLLERLAGERGIGAATGPA